MHEQDRNLVTPRLAATAVILRDGAEGIEAFMVVRHRAIEFASGALVFPGGKVDAQDADPAWAELAPARFPAEQRALRVAAAREAFEEAGLVLARRRGSPTLLTAEDALRLERYRSPLIRGETTFFALLRSEGLTLASELMIPFAHWITPEGLPKRFDTHFFLVAAPVGQLGAHDGSESVEGLWIAPAARAQRRRCGQADLGFCHRAQSQEAHAPCDGCRGGGGDGCDTDRHRDAEGHRPHRDDPHAADPRRGRLRRQ